MDRVEMKTKTAPWDKKKRGRPSRKEIRKQEVQKTSYLTNPDLLPPPLQQLHLQLSSPRLRSSRTLEGYLQTGIQFLNFLGDDATPTPDDFRRYFVHRRQQGISERSLRTYFFQLKKLAQANGWEWPFLGDDAPVPDSEPDTPALAPEAVEQLIRAAPQLSDAERFYLAMATTWGCRREEMARVRDNHYTDETITIYIAKKRHPDPKVHLIPDALKPIFRSHRSGIHTLSALSGLFDRICKKAGYQKAPGESFHSIRRTLRTVLEWKLAEQRLPLSIIADYQGWARSTKGVAYGGAAMLGVYAHHEALSSDPFALDKVIYNVHPFLPLWKA